MQIKQEISMIRTTLEINSIDGIRVPFQHGIPVPSFDAQDRMKCDLAGVWKKQRFEADHDFSLSLRDESWFMRIGEEASGRYEVNYDDQAWDTLRLPFPENQIVGLAKAHSSETYEDGVWYRRSFELGTEWAGKAITLHALAMNYIADIWINGRWVGYHEGGFTPFALDVSSSVWIGAVNTIVIRIDNPPWGSRKDIIPAVKGTDFFNYTGIIHDLYLSGSTTCHIVRVDTVPLDLQGNVKLRVVVENRGSIDAQVDLEGLIYNVNTEAEGFLDAPQASTIKGSKAEWTGDLTRSLSLRRGETRALEFIVRIINPALWSLGLPNLYVVEFNLRVEDVEDVEGEDRFITQFGIRTVTTAGTKLLVNGLSVFLTGLARHEEWPDSGRSATWERIREDLLQMRREMNVNFVRTAHYPNHVYTSILLDRLGLATVSEIPLWQFEREHYLIQEDKRLSDQMWREMIYSQYNRPSVLMWSTQNESLEVELRTAYNRRLVQDLKQNYYDGRLTTQSAAADQPGAHDLSMEPLDVAGWTVYFGIFHGGTYYDGTRDFLEKVHQCWPNKPVWITEFGHWSGEEEFFAEEQVEVYSDTLRALMEQTAVTAEGKPNADGFLIGINYWIMYDWYVNHNQWIDTFGVYHMDRKLLKPVGERIREDYLRFRENEGAVMEKSSDDE